MKKKKLKHTLVKNTLILIVSSMIIRILGLVNRVILTRLLGNEGISLYMIILPSIMLFLSLGSLSLNVTVTKLIAEKKDLSVISRSIKIAIISSIIVGIVLIIIAKPLAFSWLKQKDAYYPILLLVPLIVLTALNSVLRGYFNGIKKVNIRSISILVEQIVRITLSVILLLYFLDRGIVFAVCITIFAMGIGELGSLIYITIMIKKYRPAKLAKTSSSEVLNIAVPITASRLVGNITYFLEPIVFTFALTYLKFANDEIMFMYSATTAYTLPLITMFSFISTSIATAIIPNVAEANNNEVGNYIKKAIYYCILPAIPLSLILTSYGTEIMKLIYDTDIGGNKVEKYAILFILYYITPPLISIMQARGRSKKLLKITAFNDLLKIILIFLLPFITKDSLIIASLIPVIIIVCMLLYDLKKTYKFKFSSNQIVNLCLIAIIASLFTIIVKVGNLHYLLSSILILIVFLLASFSLRVFRWHNE